LEAGTKILGETMIEEMSLEEVITAPKLIPFADTPLLGCPMCGRRVGVWVRFWAFVFHSVVSCVELSYCPGGKVPTEEVGGMTAMVMGRSERVNICAGITEPHLHVKCRYCDYVYLMETKK
jgi:hypothetical protein